MKLYHCKPLSADITAEACAKYRKAKKHTACKTCKGLRHMTATPTPVDSVAKVTKVDTPDTVKGASTKMVAIDLVQILREQFDRRRDEAIANIMAIDDDFDRLDAAWVVIAWAKART